MAAPTLTDEHRAAILEWLCDGKNDAQVLEGLQTEFGVTCTAENISYYRAKWREEIDEAETLKYEAAKRRGWGFASKRIAAISKVLDKVEGAMEYASPGQIAQGRLGAEFRDMMNELRKELGLDKQRVELTGKDGGPFQTQAVAVAEVLNNERAVEAVCALEAALAAPGDADPGGAGEGIDGGPLATTAAPEPAEPEADGGSSGAA